MKTLVIYDSAFGNTRALATAVGKQLKADVSHISVVKKSDLKNYEFIVVASPIQGWRPMVTIGKFLEELPEGSLEGIKAASFDTRIDIFFHGDAVQKMADSLHAAGAEVVGTEFFFAQGKEGPLKKGELERALAWAKTLG